MIQKQNQQKRTTNTKILNALTVKQSAIRLIFRIFETIRRDISQKSLFLTLFNQILNNFIGQKIYCYLKPFLNKRLHIRATKELDIIELIQNEKMNGKIFYDIGSCHGLYSFWLDKYFDNIMAFEPNPKNYQVLAITKKMLRKKNIKLINKAVFSRNGILKLHNTNDPFEHSLITNETNDNSNYTFTQCVNLDTIVDSKVDLVKVDVQGVALEVLAGSFKAMPKIQRWIIELESNELHKKQELKKILESNNYNVSWLSNQHIYAIKN